MILTPDTLKACVAGHLNVDPVAVELRPIATGKFNSSFFVTVGDEEFVLRIAPADEVFCLFYERRMMAQEPPLHALLLAQTSIPVPKILVYDQSRKQIDRNYLLMQRLPGLPMSEARVADPEKVLHAVGNCLRQAHGLTAESHGYIGEHHPMPPQSSWLDAFAMMWHRLLDDVVATGLYTAEEDRRLRQLLDEHLGCFDRPVISRLLHMDVWAQNILVDGAGGLTGLIDWDRALWGDVEIEFAVLDYCGISTPAFWEGYGEQREDSPEARVRHVFYFLYELQKYIPIRCFRGGNAAGATGFRDQAMSIIAKAFGAE